MYYLSPAVVDTVEYFSDFLHLFLGRFLEKFVPSMLAQQTVETVKIPLYFDDHHV